MKIAMGADHGGVELKDAMKAMLEAEGHEVTDHGAHGPASVDYPDFAHPVCRDVEGGRAEFGVLVCGSGIGMAIAANRHRGIRAAVLPGALEAKLTRQHNGANVACFGARLHATPGIAMQALQTFLRTPYEGGRHDARLAKLDKLALSPP